MTNDVKSRNSSTCSKHLNSQPANCSHTLDSGSSACDCCVHASPIHGFVKIDTVCSRLQTFAVYLCIARGANAIPHGSTVDEALRHVFGGHTTQGTLAWPLIAEKQKDPVVSDPVD